MVRRRLLVRHLMQRTAGFLRRRFLIQK